MNSPRTNKWIATRVTEKASNFDQAVIMSKKLLSASFTITPTDVKKRPRYRDMVKEAISFLNERKGSSRQAISKFIENTYNLSSDNKSVQTRLKMSLVRGVNDGYFIQTSGSGANGSFKVKKEEKKKEKAKLNKKIVNESNTNNMTKKTKSPQKTKMSPKKSKNPLPKLEVEPASSNDTSTPKNVKNLKASKGKLISNNGKTIKPSLLTPHKKRAKQLTRILTPKKVIIKPKSKARLAKV